jgi:ribulose-phosphate 3-epimerase
LHLRKQLKEAELAGADRIQIDVMDGHFVPKISQRIPIVKAVKGDFPGIRSSSHD